MSGYEKIDAILRQWAQARGLHVYAGHKQNEVRSITVYLWMGDRHESTGHIWLDPQNELGLIGVHAAAGSFRFDDAVAPDRLADALDAVSERLTERKQRTDAAAQTSISPRM
jgi:hypothetical protein